MYSLTNSINWAKPFIQYSPLTAGTLQEPAISTATMIRNSLLSIPWPWNRSEVTQAITAGTQDYTLSVIDFGFVEKAMLVDDQGNSTELTTVYNREPLAPALTPSSRPTFLSILTLNPYTSMKIRLLGTPKASYTLTITYQKIAPQFVGGDVITGVTFAGGQDTFAGTFTVGAYPVGSLVTIAGMGISGNNGTFTVVSANATTLVVTNAAGATETHAGTATNPFWSPIPDNYMDIYNNLFLSEAFALVDDPQRAMVYRQRGVAAFLGRASMLSETEKNIFLNQWNVGVRETAQLGLSTQQGTVTRAV